MNLKNALHLLIQIFVVIIVFVFMIYGLWQLNLIRLPSFLEKIIPDEKNEITTVISDGFEILNYISENESTNKDTVYAEISPSTLSMLLNSVSTFESFYWESETEIFSSTGSLKYEYKSRVSREKYNIEEINQQGNTVRKFISDGDKTIISENGAVGNSSRVYNDGLADFYSDSKIISIDFFKNFNFESTDTKITEIDNGEYRLISIEYSYDRNGKQMSESFVLSLDYGAVLFAERLEDGIPFYKLTTKSLYTVPDFDDNIFVIQDRS